MEHYDAIVVGGGPAGSSFAYHASKAGLRVLLIEKHKLPRFKLCAGCLSKRISSLLPEGWQKLVLNSIRGGILGYAGREEFFVPSEREIAYIIDRKDFDAFLFNKAKEAGADTLEECEFWGFEKEGVKYKVFTSKGIFYSSYLVGADGFHSKVAKALGYKKKKFFKALEFFTQCPLEDKVIIDIGLLKRGYAWVFPKGELCSVGLASDRDKDLMDILKNYSKLRGINIREKIYGWHIPYAEKEEDIFYGKERVLLIGDSANLTDPLLGEGIYYAVWSGKLAVKSLLENPENPTESYKKLLKDIKEELYYAGKIARLAYRFQRVAYKMGKKGVLKSYYQLLEGGKTYKELYKKGWLYFIGELTKYLLTLHK